MDDTYTTIVETTTGCMEKKQQRHTKITQQPQPIRVRNYSNNIITLGHTDQDTRTLLSVCIITHKNNTHHNKNQKVE